jgi:hypothetical protein
MTDTNAETSFEGERPRAVQRAAAAEINGRRVNEAIERGAQGTGTAVFVCECGNLGCSKTVELTISEYEQVRTGFERFLVAPDHQIDPIEDVVEQHGSYLVVAKRDDLAVEMAYATDERDDG